MGDEGVGFRKIVVGDTRWHFAFEFDPPRNLTSAERDAMERAVIDAANAFLATLPEEPQG